MSKCDYNQWCHLSVRDFFAWHWKQVGWGAGGAEKIYSWIKVPLGKTLSMDKYMYVTKESIFIPWIWNQPVCFSFVELMISICKLNGRSLLKRDWLFHREFIWQHNVKRRYTVAWSDQFLMRFIGKKFQLKIHWLLKLSVTVLLALIWFVECDQTWTISSVSVAISKKKKEKKLRFVISW